LKLILGGPSIIGMSGTEDHDPPWVNHNAAYKPRLSRGNISSQLPPGIRTIPSLFGRSGTNNPVATLLPFLPQHNPGASLCDAMVQQNYPDVRRVQPRVTDSYNSNDEKENEPVENLQNEIVGSITKRFAAHE